MWCFYLSIAFLYWLFCFNKRSDYSFHHFLINHLTSLHTLCRSNDERLKCINIVPPASSASWLNLTEVHLSFYSIRTSLKIAMGFPLRGSQQGLVKPLLEHTDVLISTKDKDQAVSAVGVHQPICYRDVMGNTFIWSTLYYHLTH